MRRIRIGASLIGILFRLVYAIFGLWAIMVNSMGGGINVANLRFQYLLLLFAPFSLIAATVVAWKQERIAGWWLIVGGVAMAILITLQVSPQLTAMSEASVAAVCALPMLAAGTLWLLDASRTTRRMQP